MRRSLTFYRATGGSIVLKQTNFPRCAHSPSYTNFSLKLHFPGNWPPSPQPSPPVGAREVRVGRASCEKQKAEIERRKAETKRLRYFFNNPWQMVQFQTITRIRQRTGRPSLFISSLSVARFCVLFYIPGGLNHFRIVGRHCTAFIRGCPAGQPTALVPLLM